MMLSWVVLAPALLSAPPAADAPARIEAVRYRKTGDAAEFAVRLSRPLATPATVRRMGGHVAFALPQVRHDAARTVIDARDPLFSTAVLLSRDKEVLLALHTKDERIAGRARVESSGRELRLLLYRTDAALQAADTARDLERAFEGKEPGHADRTAPAADPTSAAAAPPSPAPAKDAAAPAPAPAAPPATVGRPLKAAAPSGPFGESARTWAAAALLLLVAAAAFWYIRRGRAAGPRASASVIRVVAAHPLVGGKRHVVLVEVRGEQFLLGSAEHAISLLARMEPEAPGASAAPPATNGMGRWISRLRDALGPPQGPAPASVPIDLGKRAAPAAIAEPAPPAHNPAWASALDEAIAARPPEASEPASSTAEILRRKLAELNRL